MSKKHYLVMDIGGTWCRAKILNENKKTIYRYRKKIVEKDILVCLNKLLDRKVEIKEIEKVGVSVAGIVNKENSKVVYAPNLNLNEYHLSRWFKKNFNLNTYIERDTIAAAWGENHYGVGRNKKNFVLISIGSGIGGAIINNNRLYEGAGGTAGHFGHMTIDFEGEACNCGMNVGCAEDYASGRALQNMLRKEFEDMDTKPEDFQELVKKKESGNKKAQKVLTKYLNALSAMVCNVVFILNPKAIILGGGLGSENYLLANYLEDIVNERIEKNFRRDLEIIPSTLGENSSLLGMFALIRNKGQGG